MRIRSGLLVACMVVVPLIAMFSHRVPPDARAAVAAFFHDMVRPNGTLPSVGGEPASLPQAAAVPIQAPVAPATSTVAADAPRVVPVAATLPPRSPEADPVDMLRALGAVAIDCRPLQGQGGHVASCRLPVDESGQLERVFQTVGSDPAAAVGNLLREVRDWKQGPPRGRAGAMRF
jgi:hypothetical protein